MIRRFAGPIGGIAQRLERRSGPADREPVDQLGDHRTGCIVGELRDAGDRFLAGRKTFETSRPRRIDRRLHRTGLEGDDHATIGLDLLEGRPGGFAEAVRERLDETGAGGRVDETVDTGLLDQQVMDIAGVPASERGVGAVERQDGHRVGAADTSAERRRRRAEHVHRRIARENIAGDVTAWNRDGWVSTPQAASTEPHRDRAARSRAIVRN